MVASSITPPFFAAQKKKIPKPKTSAHPKNKESANFFWVGFLDSVKFSDPSKTPQASFHADPHSKQPFVQMPWPWWFPDPNLFYVKTWNHSTETSNKKMAAESSVTRGGKMVATNTFHPGTPADNFDAVDPHEDLKTNGENGRQKKRTFLKLETFGAPNKNGAVKGKTLEILPQKMVGMVHLHHLPINYPYICIVWSSLFVHHKKPALPLPPLWNGLWCRIGSSHDTPSESWEPSAKKQTGQRSRWPKWPLVPRVKGCFTTPLVHTPKPLPTGYKWIPFIDG